MHNVPVVADAGIALSICNNVGTGEQGRATNPSRDLMQAVKNHASTSPSAPAVSWLKDDGSVSSSFTWAELWHFSGVLGEKLVKTHRLKRSDRIMVVYPFGLDFIVAFLACLRVGITVVSVYPPNPAKLAVDIKKFSHFVRDSGSSIALTTRKYASMVRYTGMMHTWPKELTWVSTDNYPRKVPVVAQSLPHDCEFASHELAFIQYTSGSTGNPKGVMITFGNLQHQLTVLSQFGTEMFGCYVGWLPQFHDMGLFNILTALYNKTPAYMASPIQFISNPILWPKAIEKYKATWICGPNFSYGLTCKRLEQHGKRYDCSSVVFAGLGAEPTREATIDSAERVLGIRRSALTNMYGLAETCVFATASLGGPVLDESRVSVGSIAWSRARGIEVALAMPDAERGGEGAMVAVEDELQVGEVCLRSASVAAGYWGQGERSRSTFQAEIAGLEGRFLRTGDLGYVKEGQLFLCSRLKDLIIVNGRNVWPSDLEASAEQGFPEEVRPGCSAAFQASDEGAALVCEVREAASSQREVAELAERVRSVVERECGVALDRVLLVRKGAVPKTTSGKVERGRTAQMLREGELQAVAEVSVEDGPRLEDARTLLELLEASGVEEWGLSVVENGLTSLQVMQVVNVAKSALGIDIDYETLSTTPAAQLLLLYASDAPSATAASPPPAILVARPPPGLPPPPGRAGRVFRHALILTAQLVAVVGAAIPVVGLVDGCFEASSWWWASRGRAGPLVLLAVVLWMVSFTAVCILLKWIVVWKVRPGYLPLWGGRFTAWMLVERLWTLWEYAVGRFLLQTPWLNLVYLLLGARVSMTAKLESFFRCWDLVTVDAGATVTGLLYPRVFDRHGVRMGAVHIGAGARIEAGSVVQGPAEVAAEVTVEPSAVVPPHRTLEPAGSRWHGSLCRRAAEAAEGAGDAGDAKPDPGGEPPREGVDRAASVALWEGCEADAIHAELVTVPAEAPRRPQQGLHAAPELEALPPPSSSPTATPSAPSDLDEGLPDVSKPSLPDPKPSLPDPKPSLPDPGPCAGPAAAAEAARSEDARSSGGEGGEAWWGTRAAFPLLFLCASVATYSTATAAVPAVDPRAAAWTRAGVAAALSYVACFVLSGLQLAALAVLLKWSFLSPFLTDAFAAAALGTFLPFVERSPSLVPLWHSLMGMRIAAGASVFFTWTCVPSKAHLVSVGRRAFVFSSILAPRAPASLLAFLGGTAGSPWAESGDIVAGEGVGMYAQSRIEGGCTLGDGAQVAAFARVQRGRCVPARAVVAGSPSTQIATLPPPPQPSAPDPEAARGREAEGFVGIGAAAQAVYMLLLSGHLAYVTGVMVVAVQLEKAVPGGGELGGSVVGVAVRVVLLLAWIFAGLLLEVLLYKRVVLGRATAERVSLQSWKALSMLLGCAMWEQFVFLCVALLGGGAGYDAVLWLLGYEVEVGLVLNLSVCPPLQDAELISIEADAVVDEGAYLSSHNVTTAGVTRGATRACEGAVLHPLAGLFMSTLGRDATLYPRAKSLREVDIGDGQTWAGTPAKEALCQYLALAESGDPEDPAATPAGSR